MSLAGCQARAGLPERLDMLWQCMLSKLARVTALVRPRKLPAGPPWTPSLPLTLVTACSRFSTQAAVFASRMAPLGVAACFGLLCEYECCIGACVACRTEVVSAVTCRLMFTPVFHTAADWSSKCVTATSKLAFRAQLGQRAPAMQ